MPFNPLKYISIPVFLASLALGVLFIYLWGDELHPVYMFPTPENVGKILYKDKADNCFSYNYKETQCTSDAEDIPIQE